MKANDIAEVFREFDALWDLPSTPERTARMEEILRDLGDELYTYTYGGAAAERSGGKKMSG